MSDPKTHALIGNCLNITRCWEVVDKNNSNELATLGDAKGPLVKLQGLGGGASLLISVDLARQLLEGLPAMLEAPVDALTREKAALIEERGFVPIGDVVEA